ncbi:hypothetical protein BD560DRAFT_368811 [Blakeslea trispora]|nr:hypothetical protein BD560DRAFT_368811 [Blakeslea trispora]
MEIQLLPEFGWLVDDTPIYGPGSVFQGFIRAQFPKDQLSKSHRLRIVFHATEAVYQSGFRSPVYKRQLFGSQKILWSRKDDTNQIPFKHNTKSSIPFIIQLPMVQFPPQSAVTSDGKEMSYHCDYVLSAYLEDAENRSISTCHKPVVYMPYVETSLSKRPVYISPQPSSKKASKELNQPSIKVRLPSLDFPLGQTIPITLLLSQILSDSIDMIHTKFYQIQTWHRFASSTGRSKKQDRKFKHLICQSIKKLALDEHDSINKLETSLDLPDIVLPTFTYGSVFSITYSLELTVKQKGIWPRRFEVINVPIRLGTLGYCSKLPETLQLYTAFNGVFEPQCQDSQATLPVPHFVEVVEYEEALPVYIDERLPSYTSTTYSSLENCIT